MIYAETPSLPNYPLTRPEFVTPPLSLLFAPSQLVKKTKDEKKKVLHEQLSLIQAEKEKVESQCEGLQVSLFVCFIIEASLFPLSVPVISFYMI